MREEISTAEAVRLRIRDYTCTRACKECGSKERHLVTWSANYAFCTICYPSEGVKSASIAKREINKENSRKRKLLSVNPLPVVFGGMGTGKR